MGEDGGKGTIWMMRAGISIVHLLGMTPLVRPCYRVYRAQPHKPQANPTDLKKVN
jgi:hypothetical protein